MQLRGRLGRVGQRASVSVLSRRQLTRPVLRMFSAGPPVTEKSGEVLKETRFRKMVDPLVPSAARGEEEGLRHIDQHEITEGCCLFHFPEKTTVVPPKKGGLKLDPSLYPVHFDKRMKSLIKAAPEPGLRYTDVNVPVCGSNDVLIKITKTAICGTDLHIWGWDAWAQRTVPTPMTTGHEFVGTVAEIGSNVKGGFAIGDRVTGEGHITCGYCRNCRAGKRHLCRNTVGLGVNRPGCFGEYVCLPAVNVFPVPPQVPSDIAAFMDPLGNAVHSALSFNLVGEDVLITGAGPIGMMCAAICRQVGARHIVVTDVNAYRLNLAKHCGATEVVNVKDGNDRIKSVMAGLGMREGFDVGLEMSGQASALNLMLNVMNHGGKVSLLGIPAAPFAINWDDVIFKGLTLKGIYGREMFETWYVMSNLLVGGLTERIRPVLTHVVAIDDFERGFKSSASASSGKVVLDWE